MKDKTLKQLYKIHNAVAEAINELNQDAADLAAFTDVPEDDRPPILPCIRILSNGATELYNCKTGEAIP